MKEQVIDTILALKNSPSIAGFREGLQLYQQIKPYTANPASIPQLITSLGKILRTHDFENPARHSERSEESNQKTVIPVYEEQRSNTGTSDNSAMSTEARIHTDIGRMIRELRYFSRQLIAATSDAERKRLYKEADQLNSAIERNKELVRQLSRGNKVKYTNTYFEKEVESHFEVPDNILQLDKKYRQMMALRSKRLAKANKMEEKHGTDSPQHHEALAEWKHFNEVVIHLKSKIDEFTHTGS